MAAQFHSDMFPVAINFIISMSCKLTATSLSNMHELKQIFVLKVRFDCLVRL